MCEPSQRYSKVRIDSRFLEKVSDGFILLDRRFRMMSHELRTPLNSIVGFSQIMLDDGLNGLNDVQQERAGKIVKAGQHLGRSPLGLSGCRSMRRYISKTRASESRITAERTPTSSDEGAK